MSVAPKASTPAWPVPPEGGWTADDLDRLPNLPPHTELIDGRLVFVSPQTLFHARAIARAAVHAFELEPTTGTYASVGIFRERMKTDVPFPVDLDLTQIKTRRTAAQ